ncbi:MAG: hypothetical protein AAFW59_02535 [Pseudomonadota bacterium]
MIIGTRFAPAALALLAALTSSASAQVVVESGLSFFQPAKVGELEVTPYNLISDTRCADPDFCFKTNSAVVSVFMVDERGPQRMDLRLGQPIRVPGGFLMLAKTGVEPSANGAISIEKYRLELRFLPDQSASEGS